MKKCKHCNKDFEPKTKKAVYCSTNCRVMAHQSKGRKTDAVNAELVERIEPGQIKCDLCGKHRRPYNMGAQAFLYEKTQEKITILVCQDHFESHTWKLNEKDFEKARTLAIVRGSKGKAIFKEGGLVLGSSL